MRALRRTAAWVAAVGTALGVLSGCADGASGSLAGYSSGSGVVEPVGARPAAAVPGDVDALQWQQTDVAGTERRYLLQTAGTSPNAPLLIALHGLNQRAWSFARATGLDAAAARAGVVLVVPEMADGAWDDGRFAGQRADDDGFVVSVVHDLVARGLVDPSRVVAVGYSNGAGLSMALASRHPDLLAGLVVISGALVDAPGAPRPRTPVPVWFAHGTDDPIQPWGGRGVRGPRMPAQLSVTSTVRAFRLADGAVAPGDVSVRRGAPGELDVPTQVWHGPHTDVTLFTLPGAGHVWPVRASEVSRLHAASPQGCPLRAAAVDATALAIRVATTMHRDPAPPATA